MPSELWIFGYGSLVWRPSFEFAERRHGWIEGWTRRFWQGSTDHRGVPEAPGRVLTLVREPSARCHGLAYRVEAGARQRVLDALDRRESGGFERLEVDVQLAGGQTRLASVYVAAPGNPNYLGPAPVEAMAAQIQTARGPSGPNREYLVRLAEALREIGAADAHVEELVQCLDRPEAPAGERRGDA